jgi:hypothetical protein
MKEGIGISITCSLAILRASLVQSKHLHACCVGLEITRSLAFSLVQLNLRRIDSMVTHGITCSLS